MFCMHCGKQIPDSSRFCAFCGKELSVPKPAVPEAGEEAGAAPEVIPAPQPEKSQTPPAPAAKKKARLRWKWTKKTIAILAAALVVIAVLVAVIVSASRKVTVPDFDAYIYSESQRSSDENRVFYEGEDLREQVYAYIKLISSWSWQNDYGSYFYKIKESGSGESVVISLYTYHGGGDTDIIVRYEFDDHELTIEYGKNVRRKVTGDRFEGVDKIPASGYPLYDLYSALLGDEVNAALGSAATGSNSGASASSPAVLTGKGVLPSPDAFFGGRLARVYDEDGYNVRQKTGEIYTQGWRITFMSDLSAVDAFKEYAELIAADYGLSIAESWDETILYIINYYYVFECDGEDDPVESIDNLTGEKERRGDLIIDIQRDAMREVCHMTILFDPDYFTFVDSGKVYSGDIVDLSGQSTSSGSSDVSSSGTWNHSKTPCTICNNGDCKKCGGTGYLYSSASGKNDRNCTGAYCNNGTCTNCGGDGWRD